MRDGQAESLESGSLLRIALFALVLVVECLLAILVPHPRFGLRSYQRGVPFVFGVALLIFGGKQLAASGIQRFPIRYRFAFLNIAAFGLFLLVGRRLAVLTKTGQPLEVPIWHFPVSAALWTALLVLLILALTAVIMPLRESLHVSRRLGAAWLYAAVCALIATQVRGYASGAWDIPSSRFELFLLDATFNSTKFLLQLIYPIVVAHPDERTLGTPRFLVMIRGVCSGMEGLILIGVLTVAWLIFDRRGLRMRRAILLIPLSAVVMWLMNLIRLTILIAIGDAGHPKTALDGFHSQAGWISFNLVSVGFLLVAHRVQWFRKLEPASAPLHAEATTEPVRWRNIPAIYLAPFVAIVAASLISKAATGGFEWLNPLRFVAAVAVLWGFRKEYRGMDWRFGWLGPLAGLAVAALWVAVSFGLRRVHPAPDVTAIGLARLPEGRRIAWIVVRTLAAITTVPIAEELAFRGFVARRVMKADVESVPYEQLTVFSILISSVVFGLMHGEMWPAGMVAGVIFALVAKFRGRLGEAFAAHAVANLAIAVVVLARHNYSLW